MRRLLPAALAAGILGAGCAGETETLTTTVSETETVVETVTSEETETVVEPVAIGLPDPVAATHSALLEAARSGDYEQLRPLIPQDFSYTFGGPVEGGPIAYWQQVEASSDERPIEILARILQLPYTLAASTYVWPFAYDKQPEELTDYERDLLGDQADFFGAGSGYLGWRAGIDPDGTFLFFIAGD